MDRLSEFETEKQNILKSYFIDLISLLNKELLKNEIDSLLESLPFSIDDLHQKTTNLTFQQYLNILSQVNKNFRIPGIGLKLGAMKSVRNFGIYGYALMSSSTYEQFTAIANRIFYAIYESLSIQHSIVNNKLKIHYFSKYHLPKDVYISLMEQVVACGINLMKAQLPISTDWSECILSCDYQAPDYAEDYSNYFSGKIEFNQPSMQLCVPSSWLDLDLSTGNSYVFSLCEDKVNNILNSLKNEKYLSNKLKYILLRSNFNQLPTIGNVAHQLNMSERNFRLHLFEEGTSYREILNEVRNEIAYRYLKESDLSVQQIAFALGYGHVQNFYRAFLKKNNITPEKFRQQP